MKLDSSGAAIDANKYYAYNGAKVVGKGYGTLAIAKAIATDNASKGGAPLASLGFALGAVLLNEGV